MTLNFVNIHGQRISTASTAPVKRAKREAPESYHKGWRVQGIPPGALESAREGHARVVAMAEKSGGKKIAAFDEANWLMNARRKSVRGKPYSIPSAAQECAALAERAGWLRVEIVELKKESVVA